MTKWFTFVLVGAMFLAFCGCSSTSTASDDFQAEIAQMRADQEDMVDELQSKQRWDKTFRNVGDDLMRQNWLEWPVAIPLWGLTYVFTGHQRRDFLKLHRDMDRYFFNAPWDDPYLVD